MNKSIIMLLCGVLVGCDGVPSCEDSKSLDLVMNIITDDDKDLKRYITMTSLSEESYNKENQNRTCLAIFDKSSYSKTIINKISSGGLNPNNGPEGVFAFAIASQVDNNNSMNFKYIIYPEKADGDDSYSIRYKQFEQIAIKNFLTVMNGLEDVYENSGEQPSTEDYE